MSEKRYRLVLDRLLYGAPIVDIAAFLQRQCGLPKRTIRTILASPPRTIMEIQALHRSENILKEMERLRCVVTLEELHPSPVRRFMFPKSAARTLTRELSKTLRSKSALALILTYVRSTNPKYILPSMVGSFKDRVLDHFRISDTSISLDDSHLILLCFTTGRDGIPIVRKKLLRAYKELLGESAEVWIGISHFPEDARNYNDLIALAETDMKLATSDDPQAAGVSFPVDSFQQKDSHASLKLCFTQARGRIFDRLLTIDPQIIWLGLSKLSQEDQIAFVDRLPFDSALVSELNHRIETAALPDRDATSEHHFEAIIHQMELEEGIAGRAEIREQILAHLAQTETLPTLPTTAMEIFNIASNPNSSADQLSHLIMNDPSLTSKLLQTVNSAFYSTHQSVETVQQAVVLLGTDEIVDIAFGLAAAKVFDTSISKGPIGPKGLWHHSIFTALIAEALCRHTSGFDDAEVFTAALLHDVGKIFFIDYLREQYVALYQEEGQDLPVFDLEEERFGLNHALIGNNLSTHWNLPSSLVQSIAFHHQPHESPDHPQLAAIVGLADYLYYQALSITNAPSAPRAAPRSRLTYGHWRLLATALPNFSGALLESLSREAAEIMQSKAYLTAMAQEK